MNIRRFLLLTAIAVVACTATASHVLLDGVLEQSTIYPGTVHTFQVYVPDRYDGKRPAALYVGLDGVLCNAPAVMDSLIAERKMPMAIGVFLQPGIIKDSVGTVLRYNRCYEFDNTTGAFADFLESELLPAVEQMTTPKGKPIRLSRRPGDRMIFGLSSGGIAAFNAAWHRPDLFGKVFTGVGTFVAMRGGNDLQALVRKTEPLPLRVFIQDGSNDAWNPLFGHWYEGNQLLASALTFAGYDVQCDWSDGGHNVTRSTQIFSQVMEWMWRDWPTPPTVGESQNDFLQSLLIEEDTGWERIGEGARRTPVKRIIYPDLTNIAMIPEEPGNAVWQYILQDGQPTHGEPFYWLHNDDNSRPLDIQTINFDGDGNLWVATGIGIQICDQNGRVRAILRLPHGCSPVNEIIISDGLVTLSTATATWQRRFNVAAPTLGTRPKSQGQG
jgi:enterochelin esterase-like enzyme